MKKNKVWIIGASQMAIDYYNVLDNLQQEVIVVGRGIESAELFEKQTDTKPFVGGLKEYLTTNPSQPSHVIVAVGVEQLFFITEQLINYNIKNILVEKPAGINLTEIKTLAEKADSTGTKIFVAYNRRHYTSVQLAKKLIDEDGGATSFHFEFTEWSHVIAKLDKMEEVKQAWFLANSTHVIDMAFHLGGWPKEMHCFVSGSCDWHSPTIYSGAGVCTNGALFSYSSNWQAPGRWSVEILTKSHRYIFKPLEKLQVQKIGSVATEFIELPNDLDDKFKPGLFEQTRKFITSDTDEFCTIADQLHNFELLYMPINEGGHL